MIAVDEVGGPGGTVGHADEQVDAMTLEQPVDPLGPREPRRLGFRLEIGGIVQPALGLGQLEQRLVEPAQLLRVRLVEGDQVGESLWPVQIGRASFREECFSSWKSRWLPYHLKK